MGLLGPFHFLKFQFFDDLCEGSKGQFKFHLRLCHPKGLGKIAEFGSDAVEKGEWEGL